MFSLEKFDKLSKAPIARKAVALASVGRSGEHVTAWSSKLARLDKHDQYQHAKSVLGELVIADIEESVRFGILEAMMPTIERLIMQMQNEYISNPQTSPREQKAYVDEVRSLYFLIILSYQSVAFATHKTLTEAASVAPKKNTNWFKKMTEGLGNVTKNGVGVDVIGESKKLHTLSVYRIMLSCYRLINDFALTYQKSPACLWRLMNGWYLKASTLGIVKTNVGKLGNYAECSIHKQYLYSCIASFINLFAYRRADIVNMFKLLPQWAERVETTFEAQSHFRVFVNLQGETSPELITPFASINPYSNDHVCLFFDVRQLFEHLKSLEHDEDAKNSFEARLAGMVMLAFNRHLEQPSTKITNRSAYMLTGFGAIYREIAGERSFDQIIAQSQLRTEFHPKRIFDATADSQKEQVQLIRRNDTGAQFIVGGFAQDDEEKVLSRPYLPVFGLFAMMSLRSDNTHPWRLGIVHWAESKEDSVEVDGRFLGRILSVCGIRLSTRDMRSQDFVQAFLVSGDQLNQQTTLVLPRYHFKEGDLVILRVADKETTLRLEKNVLSADDIEQYQIVRLSS